MLVTGASGFLGGHVARHLAKVGHDVLGFDLVDAQGSLFPAVVGDITDLASISGAMRGCDAVCHLGAIGDVYLAEEKPATASLTNVVGSANVGLAAEETGARVVYASTWEVYGEPLYEPLDERHPCSPDHPYSITKLAGEQLLLAADRLRDVPALSLRLGTAYGTGLRPNSVFRLFIDRARRGDPITVQGDGSQGRQFTHAIDLAQAFDLAMTSELRGVALNVAADEFVTIRDLALLVAAEYPTDVTFGDPRPGDVPPATVSSETAKAQLGWYAQVPFATGFRELLLEPSSSE